MTGAGLAVDIEVEVGAFRLDVELVAEPGETVAVLGPNGAGKSTLLRALAGLTTVTSGTVAVGGEVLDDTDRRLHRHPEHRRVGFVFQDHLLFPHLTALDNVAFGLHARGWRRHRARAEARLWLERVGVGDLDGRRPAQLSGGQAQRVALARALAVDPQLVLLDEPLAALDAAARVSMRRELRRQLGGRGPVHVLVTHDPLDAAALADRIVVLEDGAVVQSGTLAEISRAPRTRFAADLVGVNLFQGRAVGGLVHVGDGFEVVTADATEGDVFLTVHPRALSLSVDPPSGSARNAWAGRVSDVDPAGERVRVTVAVAGAPDMVAEVTPAAVSALGLDRGRHVWVALKATEVVVSPA